MATTLIVTWAENVKLWNFQSCHHACTITNEALSVRIIFLIGRGVRLCLMFGQTLLSKYTIVTNKAYIWQASQAFYLSSCNSLKELMRYDEISSKIIARASKKFVFNLKILSIETHFDAFLLASYFSRTNLLPCKI